MANNIGRWVTLIMVLLNLTNFRNGTTVDSKEELMLLICILDDSHERVRQNSDENCHNEEVTEEEEANQDGFS
ncbi:hypothetical protein KCU83_g361, partial [Aureobasidium melanogenum]